VLMWRLLGSCVKDDANDSTTASTQGDTLVVPLVCRAAGR
jgi:hypothetical protein